MRLAVLSDIHGNLAALQAVLADLQAQAPDDVLCLGDAVGYGPEPDAVVACLQQARIPCLQGNHELGVLKPEKRQWFNPTARRSLDITLGLLSAETLAIIAAWPDRIAGPDYLAVHGCPPDDAFRYLFECEEEELATMFGQFSQPVCFVGHTHTLFLVRWDGREATLTEISPGLFSLERSCRYIVNVGSVGQPRDGTASAKYAIWDNSRFVLEIRAVAYDTAATIAKIEALDFPAINTRCLRG
jgi:diadenosine tetraphosphatase ApaH/serine/threonine PP2A family protein phosphatase